MNRAPRGSGPPGRRTGLTLGWGGAESHRDQPTFWNPSTPNPSSKEEGLRFVPHPRDAKYAWIGCTSNAWARIAAIARAAATLPGAVVK